jgi:toxin ParE1/3/4
MAKYRLTKEAENDLLKIFLYSFEIFGLAQAEEYRKDIIQCFELLAENPRLGRNADKFAPGARRHEQAHHVIFYDAQSDGVLVICIVHERSMPRAGN